MTSGLLFVVGAHVIQAQSASELMAIGRAHLQANRLLQAGDAFAMATRRDSLNAEGWNGLGAALNRLEFYARATDGRGRLRPTSTAVCRPPRTFRLSTRTLSKKVSQNGDFPEMSSVGPVLTPGEAMSNRTKLIPACFFPASVRTRQKIQSARSA
jgi:hypothetical protein